MGIQKDVSSKIKSNKELYTLILIGGLYSLSTALSNTFVNVYLWKQNEALMDLGIYNLAVVLLQGAAFLAAGGLAKRVDRIIVLRIGVCFLATFYLVVLMFTSASRIYLVLIGSLLGLGYGFYWLAYNLLTFEITEPETRDFFNGLQGISGSFGGMVGPFFAGYVISSLTGDTGYLIIFGLSLSLFVVAVICSFFLQKRAAEGKYRLRDVMMERKQNRDWKRITYANYSQGLREGVFVFIISVFVFVETGSEMALGTFTLISSGISFLAYFLVGKYLKVKYRKTSMLVGAMLLYAAIAFLVYQVSYVKLLIFASIIALAYPLLFVPYMSLTYDVIGKAKEAASYRIEYIVIRELYLNAGRATSILVFMGIILLLPEPIGIKILLLGAGTGHVFVYFFVRKVAMGNND